MKAVPIYIRKIQVENVKTFVKSVELDLTKPDDTISQWTLILGDNGVGKSTLLQLIAWMKPELSDAKNSKSGPRIESEENEVLEHLVHRSIQKKQTATIRATFIANQKLNQEVLTKDIGVTNMSIILNKKGKLDDIKSRFTPGKGKREIFLKNEVHIYAYSASRKLGRLNLNNPDLADTIPNFIQEKTELYDIEELLHLLNYAALGAEPKDKEKYDSFINKVKQMLVTLLPDVEKNQDFEINPPNVLDQEFEGGIVISTKHGRKIPLSDFSLGYRTVASWTMDLAWRLFNRYYNKLKSENIDEESIMLENPLEEPGIVLIDEIDLHLHPFWQQKIMAGLSEHFPNIQFIATAHSPLMVQASVQSNHAVLKFDEGSVKIENEPENIDGWRVDQILTSEFFGLKSSRGPEYDSLMTQRENLLNKKNPTKKDKAELENITSKLANLPTGETSEEMKSRKLISELAKRIKEKNIN